MDRWPESGEWRVANLSSFSYWVKVISIPLQLLVERNVRRIANNAGKVEEVQFESAQKAHWRNFIRFKAIINTKTVICLFLGMASKFGYSSNKRGWQSYATSVAPLVINNFNVKQYKKWFLKGTRRLSTSLGIGSSQTVILGTVSKLPNWVMENI